MHSLKRRFQLKPGREVRLVNRWLVNRSGDKVREKMAVQFSAKFHSPRNRREDWISSGCFNGTHSHVTQSQNVVSLSRLFIDNFELQVM